MEKFDSIENLAKEIKKKLKVTKKKKIGALYAFNSTGKTRLSTILNESNREDEESDGKIKVLCYNAFLEDMFIWDNENYVLSFNTNSWIVKLVIDQGLDGDIIDNFKDIINSNIEPSFDFTNGEIAFNVVSGDDNSKNNIKISKGEESIFIWSFFYTILKSAIETLNIEESNRPTPVFNDLGRIVIDDPVSSLDDTKIITMTIKLVETIESFEGDSLSFFIATHHALFYNILVNSFKRNSGCNFKSYNLIKDNYTFQLLKQGDTPFSYHLSIKKIIQEAIIGNHIERYHFNLFRSLLEKTSTFLGYDDWRKCVPSGRKAEFIRLLNLYSHGKLSDIESRQMSGEDKIIFEETFTNFVSDFKWG